MSYRYQVGILFVGSLFIASANGENNLPKPKADEPVFEVPPGFVVEKVAGPDLVRYPLFAAFDDRGRLYVAEGTGTNLSGEELVQRKLGKIVLLEDTDGDGKFDKSSVFADGLVFPQGVLWHDGAVYTMSHPSMWKLEDPQGKGVATKRTELVTHFNFNGNGCDIHGPFLGPDGRLYWTDGRHGYNVKTKEGKLLEGLASRIWRCRIDGSEIERLCGGGFDNPVELAWTPEGEMLGTMDQGPGDMLLHYVEGGVYPMEHPCLSEFPRTGPLLGGVQQYSAALPAALCGLMRYHSDSLGKKYQNSLFSTHYMVHKVVQHKLIPNGSTFRAEDVDFVTTNHHDVRLTDVLEDADGSLLFIDMGSWYTYGFPGNPIPKPEALGGIYRVRRKDASKIDDPWGQKAKLATLSASDLTRFLQDPRPKVRDQAIHYLARHGENAVSALEQVLKTDGKENVETRRNAVWALCRIPGPQARKALQFGLKDKEKSVRIAAAHGVGLERDASALELLSELVRNDETAVRRKAAESLGRIGKSQAIPAIADGLRKGDPVAEQPETGLRKGGDRHLEHSLIYALIQINDEALTAPLLEDKKPSVQRAALIALYQMKDPQIPETRLTALLKSNDPELQYTAMDVLSRRPDQTKTTADVLRQWLAGTELSSGQERAVANFFNPPLPGFAIQKVIDDAISNPKTAEKIRVLLLSNIEKSGINRLPALWLRGIGQSIKHEEISVRRQAIAAIKAKYIVELFRSLEELSKDAKQPLDVRIAAIECFAPKGRQLETAHFDLLMSQISETADPFNRLAAARTLAACRLSDSELIALAGQLKKANTLVLRILLPAFSKAGDSKVGSALVDALSQSTGAEALTSAQLAQVLTTYSEEVRNRAGPLRQKLLEREKGQAAYLAKIAAELESLRGDADAGQEILLSKKSACYTCHRAVGRGGQVGPDLSKIGRIRTRAELLESLVYPSLVIAPEFRSFKVNLKDGKSAQGLIINQSADAIMIRTAELAEIRIARGDIEELAPSTVSLMPEGLEKTMTRQELRNLLEFLMQQR